MASDDAGASYPDWWKQPDDMVGGVVPNIFVVAKTDRLALVLSRILAFPTGFIVNLAILAHRDYKLPDFHPSRVNRFTDFRENRPGWAARRPGGVLGFRFADGTAIASGEIGNPLQGTRSISEFATMTQPPEPFIACQGGGGHSRREDWSYWVAPLPPPGPVEVFVRWPAALLDESRIELDAEDIIDAADQASRIWDD